MFRYGQSYFAETLFYMDRESALSDLSDWDDEYCFRSMFAARYSEESFADYALAVSHRFFHNTYPEEYEIDGNRITSNSCGVNSHGWFMEEHCNVLYPILKTELDPNIDYKLVQVVHPLYA